MKHKLSPEDRVSYVALFRGSIAHFSKIVYTVHAIYIRIVCRTTIHIEQQRKKKQKDGAASLLLIKIALRTASVTAELTSKQCIVLFERGNLSALEQFSFTGPRSP